MRLHPANKMCEVYLLYQNQKMNVNFAAQLFSESISCVSKFCRDVLKLSDFKDCSATVTFLRNSNNVFDIFDSRNMRQKDFIKPMSSTLLLKG